MHQVDTTSAKRSKAMSEWTMETSKNPIDVYDKRDLSWVDVRMKWMRRTVDEFVQSRKDVYGVCLLIGAAQEGRECPLNHSSDALAFRLSVDAQLRELDNLLAVTCATYSLTIDAYNPATQQSIRGSVPVCVRILEPESILCIPFTRPVDCRFY